MVEVAGQEFAAFAKDMLEAWRALRLHRLTHEDHGPGVVIEVKIRPNYVPLLSVKFENRSENLLFNPAGIASPRFLRVQLPESLTTEFSKWQAQQKEIDERQAAARGIELEERAWRDRVLAKALSVGIVLAGLRSEEICLVESAIAEMERAGAGNWPRKVATAVEFVQMAQSNCRATSLYARYQEHGNPWDLINACSEYRQARLPEKVVDITSIDAVGFDATTYAAVLTTRGAALRDLNKLLAARDCAERALKVHEGQHSYNLLGAVLYAEGDFEAGDRCFDRAEELGSSRSLREGTVRSVLQMSPSAIATALAAHLRNRQR